MDLAQSQQALSGIQWTLRFADQEAVVVEVGGGLRGYTVAGSDLVDGFAEDEVCAGSAGQVLAPWPNRIRDGRYTFAGVEQELALTEPRQNNAIHGLVCWARWELVSRTESTVVLAHDLVPQPGYPWPLRLVTTWSLSADGLRADHEVTNTGCQPCPFGIATHPYLQFPGTAVDDLLLRVPASSRVVFGPRNLPIGIGEVAGGEYDFMAPRPIGQTELDMAFCDLERGPDGGSVIALSTPGGESVEVWADERFGWWQVYTGDTLEGERNRRSVAIEPMTCPPDAFRSGKDVIVLEPGDTWRGSWGIRKGD